MEIERKYLIHKLPDHLEAYPHRTLEQAYLCTEPVVRVMVEASSEELCEKYVDQVIDVLKKKGHVSES